MHSLLGQKLILFQSSKWRKLDIKLCLTHLGILFQSEMNKACRRIEPTRNDRYFSSIDVTSRFCFDRAAWRSQDPATGAFSKAQPRCLNSRKRLWAIIKHSRLSHHLNFYQALVSDTQTQPSQPPPAFVAHLALWLTRPTCRVRISTSASNACVLKQRIQASI